MFKPQVREADTLAPVDVGNMFDKPDGRLGVRHDLDLDAWRKLVLKRVPEARFTDDPQLRRPRLLHHGEDMTVLSVPKVKFETYEDHAWRPVIFAVRARPSEDGGVSYQCVGEYFCDEEVGVFICSKRKTKPGRTGKRRKKAKTITSQIE